MIGLDTTAIIDIFKKDKKVLEVIQKQEDSFSGTIINFQEIIFGLNPQNEKHVLEEEYYDGFFGEIFTFQLDNRSSKKAREIFWNLKNNGETAEKFDCMIAGILLNNGVDKIITRNVKHFNKIKELKVIPY